MPPDVDLSHLSEEERMHIQQVTAKAQVDGFNNHVQNNQMGMNQMGGPPNGMGMCDPNMMGPGGDMGMCNPNMGPGGQGPPFPGDSFPNQ